ncbi:MAG: transposase [Clostridiales bacterium]|nr:transposase [Clostridiales bacterium]
MQNLSRRDDCLETMIIRMYASGVSTREIAGMIDKLYSNSYSAATVSNITDVAIEEIDQWHNRTLKTRYSVIYIDVLHIKLRLDTVSSDAVYFILGVDEDGYRVYPKVDIQRCMVHKVRNAIRNIRKKDINEFTADLKFIYESPSYDQCKIALDEFSTKLSKSYKRLVESWSSKKLRGFSSSYDSIQDMFTERYS